MTNGQYSFRRAAAGVLDVSGPDREPFLQGQCTNDVVRLPAGGFLWAAALSPTGKVLFTFRASKAENGFRLLLARERVALAARHFRKYAVFQNVRIEEPSSDFFRFDFYEGEAPPAPLPVERWPSFYELRETWLVPADVADAVESALSAGTSITENDAEARRVEVGRPRDGFEIDETRTADEAGLGGAISTTKGCYVGQEIVARMRTYGRLPRRLVRFAFSDDRGVAPRSRLVRTGEPPKDAGLVTSAAISHRAGAIGLGYVIRDVADGETLALADDPSRTARVESIAP